MTVSILEFLLAEILTIVVVLGIVAYPVRREYLRLSAEADYWRERATAIAESHNVRVISDRPGRTDITEEQ